MKNKSVLIAVTGVAAAMLCIIAVLAIRMNNGAKPPVVSDFSDYQTSFSQEYATSYFGEEITESLTEESKNPFEWLTPESTTAENTTDAEASSAQAVSETEPQSETLTVTEKVTQAVAVINKAFYEVFTLPKAPKYIPPDTDLDFNKINLASYKYDPDGNYYYTDDKDCWQKNFGFNEVYDKLSPVSIMYYDTVRTTFEYGGKEWMIQMWKGQYGMVFVGGEVGVYTRSLGSSGTHYVCADKPDWLNMEMAFVWDEYADGNYKAIFNRPYEKYWWCTGFVVGFPNGSLRKTLKEFRLVTHIQFKDTEMANAFCDAFEANGFTRVASLDNDSPDTFVQVGPDVGLVWQNINHK